MGVFIKSIKTQILLGKIIGFLYFSRTVYGQDNVLEFFYCLPFLSIFTYGLYETVLTYIYAYTDIYTVLIGDALLLAMCALCIYGQTVQSILTKNDFKILLMRMDDLLANANRCTKSQIYLDLFFYIFLTFLILEVLFLYRFDFDEDYTLPIAIAYNFTCHMMSVQLYFTFKLLQEINSFLQHDHKLFFSTLNHASNVNAICEKFQLYTRYISVAVEINNLNGSLIAIDMLYTFLVALFSTNYSLLFYLEERKIDFSFYTNFLWMLISYARIYFTVLFWATLKNEVTNSVLSN